MKLAERQLEDTICSKVDEIIKHAEKRIYTEIDGKAAKYFDKTWDTAVKGGLLHEDAPEVERAVRNGHAAGHHKRKLGRLVCLCMRGKR